MSKKQQVTPESNNKTVAVTQSSGLPLAAPSSELVERMVEVRENLASIENFRLPRTKMHADGIILSEGEEPAKEFEAVILYAKKTNVYYEKTYNKNDLTAPDCYSLDGREPDKSVKKPQNKTCKGCPKAEFGTNSMGSGKACRNLKPLYLLMSDEAIMPKQLVVTPTSLKAIEAYLMDITSLGIPYRAIKTKISTSKKDAEDKFCVLSFKKGEKLTPEQKANVDFLLRGNAAIDPQFKGWLPVMDSQLVDQEQDSVDKPAAASQAQASGDY